MSVRPLILALGLAAAPAAAQAQGEWSVVTVPGGVASLSDAIDLHVDPVRLLAAFAGSRRIVDRRLTVPGGPAMVAARCGALTAIWRASIIGLIVILPNHHESPHVRAGVMATHDQRR